MSRLNELDVLGQSVWVDDLPRHWLLDGTLTRLIEDEAVSGVTTNPAIFAKAMQDGKEYDRDIARLAFANKTEQEIYSTLTCADVCSAADLLLPTFVRCGGEAGFVSLELNPHLAHDAAAMVEEARRLWRTVARPNLLVKVPATSAGLIAIQRLLTEGISCNVTLIFGLARYREVVDIHIEALNARAKNQLTLREVRCVASLFVSRVDAAVDAELTRVAPGLAPALRHKTALAVAASAYSHYLQTVSRDNWASLQSRGGMPPRLVWASMAPKSADLPDTYYVDALIAPQTIATLPWTTLQAFGQHGHVALTLHRFLEHADETVQAVVAAGVDLDAVSRRLEQQAVEGFVAAYDSSVALLKQQRLRLLA